MESFQLDPQSFKWQPVHQAGKIPSPRFDFAYAHDPVAGKFYVFGGQSQEEVLGDFFIFDTATCTWTEFQVEGPTPRRDASGVFFNGHFYIIGGQDSAHVFGETWIFIDASATWKLQTTMTPLAGGSVVNINDNFIFYYGGVFQDKDYSADLYVYSASLNQWEHYAQTPSPGGRCWFSLVEAQNTILLFGGYSGVQHHDMWRLSYSDEATGWSNVIASGPLPQARSGHVMVYNDVGNNLFLFGGEDSALEVLNDLWSFSLQTKQWQALAPDSPLPPRRLGAGVLQVENGLIIFGGITGWTHGDNLLNDMWILN